MKNVNFYDEVKLVDGKVGVKPENSATVTDVENFVEFFKRLQLDLNGNIKIVIKNG